MTVDVATKVPFQLIVLLATPPSLPDYYEHLLKSVPSPIRWMCAPKEKMTQRFDALSKMQFIKSPVLFIYAEKDEELPLEMARKLFSISETPNYERVVSEAGHDFEEVPEFAEEICKAVLLHIN